MSARDELAATFKASGLLTPGESFTMADVLIRRGYSKPRTITTLEELKTVYEGSILKDVHGDLWGIDGKSGRLFSIHDGADELYDDDELELPATVVYEESEPTP